MWLALGLAVGLPSVGLNESLAAGPNEIPIVGLAVGLTVGLAVWLALGLTVGLPPVGLNERLAAGPNERLAVGLAVGLVEGLSLC